MRDEDGKNIDEEFVIHSEQEPEREETRII
jgi:hypothetical protein